MKKEALVKKAEKAIAKNEGIVEVVVKTKPRLNKFSRTPNKKGEKVPCPFADVVKVSTMKIDLNAKYQPRELAEGEAKKERKAWTKPTEFSWLKESLAEEGKFYLFGKLVESKSEFLQDGKKLTSAQKRKMADYMPLKKVDESNENKDIWLTIGLDNIKTR